MYCIYMRSQWEEIEKQFQGLATEDYDADDQADIHKQYEIKDVPTIIFIDNAGREIRRVEGAKDKDEIINIIREVLN